MSIDSRDVELDATTTTIGRVKRGVPFQRNVVGVVPCGIISNCIRCIVAYGVGEMKQDAGVEEKSDIAIVTEFLAIGYHEVRYRVV